MKRYDLTSIGDSVELGKGGPVISASGTNLLINGSNILSVSKDTLTYANLLLEPTDTGNIYKVSDLNNMRFEYDTEWIPMNGRGKLAQLHLPVGIASTFTGTTNGAFTLGTALTYNFGKGFLYVAANSITASNTAGFYYCEMTTTTNGIFYNNVYTPADGVTSTEPTSKIAFAGVVPGGTGVTTEVTYLIKNIPANSLGNYGIIETTVVGSGTNSATNKQYRMRLNTTQIGLQSLTTSHFMNGKHIMKNTSPIIQRGTAIIGGLTNNVGYFGAENTTINSTYNATFQHGTATDNVLVASCLMELVK